MLRCTRWVRFLIGACVVVHSPACVLLYVPCAPAHVPLLPAPTHHTSYLPFLHATTPAWLFDYRSRFCPRLFVPIHPGFAHLISHTCCPYTFCLGLPEFDLPRFLDNLGYLISFCLLDSVHVLILPAHCVATTTFSHTDFFTGCTAFYTLPHIADTSSCLRVRCYTLFTPRAVTFVTTVAVTAITVRFSRCHTGLPFGWFTLRSHGSPTFVHCSSVGFSLRLFGYLHRSALYLLPPTV